MFEINADGTEVVGGFLCVYLTTNRTVDAEEETDAFLLQVEAEFDGNWVDWQPLNEDRTEWLFRFESERGF